MWSFNKKISTKTNALAFILKIKETNALAFTFFFNNKPIIKK